ncbi:photosynthetic reaction center subunit H [Variovorax rhizosphaerae]|uniref:Photosynthetic reaction center subunit H n=1 Tax=Variovorax rhizosphaerae TaxID=1836200 RepID=A0ABU8WQN0_9BURK
MGNGAITSYIDVAQIALYIFWAFFAGLIYYLHRENKREGYPLENDRSGQVNVQGFPGVPDPKTFLLRDGRTVSVPNALREEYELAAEPGGAWMGSPLEPTGNPMLDGIGPGAWSMRADIPDTTAEGAPRIVPLRAAPGFGSSSKDPNPIGLPVIGADGVTGGTVVDLWVDQAEMLFRYLEVETVGEIGPRRVLLPINFAKIDSQRVRVRAILGGQFGLAPNTRNPDQVTLLEEDRIVAYYGGGTLYATPQRQEPLL